MTSVAPPPGASPVLAGALASIPVQPRPGTSFVLDAGAGVGDALLLALLARRLNPLAPAAEGAAAARSAADSRVLAVLTADATSAQRLAGEIVFFDPTLRVRLLPDWETLPYDNFSPHQDLISERLDTLYGLQKGACDVVVLAATSALQRLAPASFLASHTFFFKKGQRLDEAQLRAQLVLAGYDHVSQVVRPGEYSVRGGLIDLYPMGATLPYRLCLLYTSDAADE